MTDTPVKSNSGILMTILGLIIGIISLLGGVVVFFICAGWASDKGGLLGALILAFLWAILSLTGLIISIVGRKRMVKAGRSATLGIISIVIGVIAVLLGIGIIVASFSANNTL